MNRLNPISGLLVWIILTVLGEVQIMVRPQN
jgi:hypothetical protein